MGGGRLGAGGGGVFAAAFRCLLFTASFLFFFTLNLAAGDEFLPVADDKQDGAFLQVVLDLVKVSEGPFHAQQTKLVVKALSDRVPSPVSLDDQRCKQDFVSI